jgi:glycine betaine/proline transport system ATP-binding protein
MTAKLRIENLFKIFGGDAGRALALVREGKSKAEILAATGQTIGVNGVTLHVPEGQIFVVMGLSGSGKSTLVRMINQLIAPTSGHVFVDDVDVATCSAAALREIRRQKIAMVFQHFALMPHRTVLENVAYGLKIKGVQADARMTKAMAALRQVGLEAYADSRPAELSGGMQQRVGLARALATDAEILLMDEPFGALDPLIRRDMQEELLVLQKTLKKTIVFITHDLNEALLLGDSIAIMKDGSVVQVGTAQEIVDRPANDYVAAFVADIDRGRVFTAQTVAGKPLAVQITDDAGAALQSMEENNRKALYVLDGKDIAGVVTYQDLAVASREATPALSDALITDFPKVPREAPLHELYGPASAGLPVAVTDRKNRLVGVVEPEAVLAQLSGEEPAGAGATPTSNDEVHGRA